MTRVRAQQCCCSRQLTVAAAAECMPITAPPSWIGTILAPRWSSRVLLTFSMPICRHSLSGSGTIALDSGHGLIDAIRKFMQLLKSIRHDNCWVECWTYRGLRSFGQCWPQKVHKKTQFKAGKSSQRYILSMGSKVLTTFDRHKRQKSPSSVLILFPMPPVISQIIQLLFEISTSVHEIPKSSHVKQQ